VRTQNLKLENAAAPSAHSGIEASDWAWLVALSSLWGSSFIFYRYLDTLLSPHAVVFGRLLFGGIALHILLACRRERLHLSPYLCRRYLLLGALNNAIPFALVAWSEVKLPSGIAATIGATAPLFGTLISIALAGAAEVTRARITALLLGFAGVSLVALARGTGASHIDLLSCAGALLSAFVYAAGGFYSRTFSGAAPLQTATGQITAATLLMLVVVVFTGRGPAMLMLPMRPQLALLTMGVACTGLPYLVFFRLIGRIGPANVLLVTMMIPCASLVIGYLALGETVGPSQIGGLALIIVALLLVDGRLRRRRPRPSSAG